MCTLCQCVYRKINDYDISLLKRVVCQHARYCIHCLNGSCIHRLPLFCNGLIHFDILQCLIHCICGICYPVQILIDLNGLCDFTRISIKLFNTFQHICEFFYIDCAIL